MIGNGSILEEADFGFGSQLTETDRNRMRLWRRWDITFDWFGYTQPMKRVHLALMLHRRGWSTRELAEYTDLPQTSVRRQLDIFRDSDIVNLTKDGFEMTELGYALATTYHVEIARYVRGGVLLDAKLVDVLEMSPNNSRMNFDMMRKHIWWPVIDAPEVDDA